jgi:hypothetical protein
MTQAARHHVFRSLVLVASASLPACNSITETLTQKAVEAAMEKAIEGNSGNDVDIDTSGKSVTIKTKNEKGEEVVLQTQTGQLPDG